MIEGLFTDNLPVIQVAVAWGQAVQTPFVILDTGFSGDLQVTPATAQGLGLEVVGVTKSKIASGQVIDVPVALAIASMEGATNDIQVMIANSLPLAGIGFLSKFGYKAIVDCKNRTVVLEKAV